MSLSMVPSRFLHPTPGGGAYGRRDVDPGSYMLPWFRKKIKVVRENACD